MAGTLFLKEQSIVTLTSTGASLTNLSAGVANGTADLDCRSAGNAAEVASAMFWLQMQWVTITGILNGVDVADLYLVPLVDGTNLPDLDLTAGASHISPNFYAGSFICDKQAVTNTNMLFTLGPVELFPVLYRPYILNQSGQTNTANWTLKVVAAQGSYT